MPGWFRTSTHQPSSFQTVNVLITSWMSSSDGMMEEAHLDSVTSRTHVVLSSLTLHHMWYPQHQKVKDNTHLFNLIILQLSEVISKKLGCNHPGPCSLSHTHTAHTHTPSRKDAKKGPILKKSFFLKITQKWTTNSSGFDLNSFLKKNNTHIL